MKRMTAIAGFFLCCLFTQAQTGFKTIVPQQPVVAGESFQVQYILEDADKTIQVKPPVFSNFRFVTGPNIYMGSVVTADGTRPVRNAVYTLEAVRPGKFAIPGASITINGKTVRSNNAWVEVISRNEAIKRFNAENGINVSGYFLRPGEDPYQKIRENLFIKMLVDKRACYVGEPVLATFKLYSRLESKSDIVKNPGFYGFTVYDMVNLADKQVTTENVNGKAFDVHTIRKVQLYPLQAGEFTIDAMQVKNKVEFSRSVVNKKTEQEIVEGVLADTDEEKPAEDATEYETEFSTEPVTIRVKPVPEKNKPAVFNGAIGNFRISSQIVNTVLKKNEEGFFEITISGKGNFTQLNAPVVQWPAGVEGFEPAVKDTFDKTKTPLAGSRVFRYPFVCATAGTWELPAVSFSFFDTDSNSYKTVAAKAVKVITSNEEKAKIVAGEQKISIAEKSERAARTAGIVVVSLVLLILLYWIVKKKEPEKIIPVEPEPEIPSAASWLEPAYAAMTEEDNRFYRILHGCIWNFASSRFGLSGSEMSKQLLIVKMNDAGIAADITRQLSGVLEQCEAGMFTTASLEHDKQELVSLVKQLLDTISSPGYSPDEQNQIQ
ncbi:MAG TPA: BatD family protein [Chitinophagaceae bacterium]|jgi:hypothetical protein|nr:BatD family protein [Chitinophagaceae bacterium]